MKKQKKPFKKNEKKETKLESSKLETEVSKFNPDFVKWLQKKRNAK